MFRSLSLDPWLAEQFGYDVYRVAHTPSAPAVVCAHRVGVPRAFYYTKIPISAVADLAACTAEGFTVVETQVALRADPDDVCARAVHAPHTEVDAFPEFREEVADIAATCFRYSRFHVDPSIPDELAHAIKRAWVLNYINRTRGDRLFVAVRAGHAVGFLAAMRTAVNGEERAVIDLMGVHPEAQGSGVGSALIHAFAAAYRGQVATLHVGTQAANIPSVRCYERMGFRFADAAYVLHLHHGYAATAPISLRSKQQAISHS